MCFNGKLLSAKCFNTPNIANATLRCNTFFFSLMVTLELQSRRQTPESPEQPRRMAKGSGTGGSRPHLLAAEMLQTLLAARSRPLQNSYLKLRDPESFEGEKTKFKTFLAQYELKFQTKGN